VGIQIESISIAMIAPLTLVSKPVDSIKIMAEKGGNDSLTTLMSNKLFLLGVYLEMIGR
jgi:hypothetical protein